MPKYKRLQNIARNYAHSFMSQMNTIDTEYVCDMLAGEMYRKDVDEIEIDIFATHIQPSFISQTLISEAIIHYRHDVLEHMLRAEGFISSEILSCRLSVVYDFSEIGDEPMIPYHCSVEFMHKNGNLYLGKVSDREPIGKRYFEK